VIIASYNLDSLDDTDGEQRRFETRSVVLRPKLIGLNADILCLQEIHSQKAGSERQLRALDRLLEGTPYAGYHRIHTVGEAGRSVDVHNLVTLSRYPILNSGQIRHDLVPPLPWPKLAHGEAAEPVSWDRPFLYAEIDCGSGRGRRLHVLNLHLRAPIAAHVPAGRDHGNWRSTQLWAQGFARASLKRIGQALEVRLFIDRIFDSEREALICVCGDFNAEGAEMPFRLIRAGLEDVENASLAWRQLVAVDRGGPSTIHAGLTMRPDHVLASPALASHHRRSGLMNKDLPDDTISDAADSSHAPILAEFDLG
jgi:endonuclease/exonuclease/phosphatase family metal-dependent hydrolase